MGGVKILYLYNIYTTCTWKAAGLCMESHISGNLLTWLIQCTGQYRKCKLMSLHRRKYKIVVALHYLQRH